MGLGGIGVTELLLILVIVMLLFGTKKLKNIGSDLGGAIRSFRESMADAEKNDKIVNDQSASSNQAGTHKTSHDTDRDRT